MARFDVYKFRSKTTPFVVDVQANVLDDLASRVVIPLMPALGQGGVQLSRLTPSITIVGETYLLMTTDVGALPIARLTERVVNIEDQYRDKITAAIDFVFSGF